MDVLLEHTLLVVLEIVYVVYDRDSSAPAQVGGLADPEALFIAVLVEVVDELLILIR